MKDYDIKQLAEMIKATKKAIETNNEVIKKLERINNLESNKKVQLSLSK